MTSTMEIPNFEVDIEYIKPCLNSAFSKNLKTKESSKEKSEDIPDLAVSSWSDGKETNPNNPFMNDRELYQSRRFPSTRFASMKEEEDISFYNDEEDDETDLCSQDVDDSCESSSVASSPLIGKLPAHEECEDGNQDDLVSVESSIPSISSFSGSAFDILSAVIQQQQGQNEDYPNPLVGESCGPATSICSRRNQRRQSLSRIPSCIVLLPNALEQEDDVEEKAIDYEHTKDLSQQPKIFRKQLLATDHATLTTATTVSSSCTLQQLESSSPSLPPQESLELRLQRAEELIQSYRSTIQSHEHLVDSLHQTLAETREQAYNLISSHKELGGMVELLQQEQESAVLSYDKVFDDPKFLVKLAMGASLLLYFTGMASEYALIATVVVYLLEDFM